MDLRPKKIFNYNLEVLRGCAALVVVLSHIVSHGRVFNPNITLGVLKLMRPPAHLAVLIFFVLSGYVIGINHKEPMAGGDISKYFRKRFLRIYPIYFICTAAAFLLALPRFSWGEVISNFTLTQNILYPRFQENVPAWSLNFEVLYYILFVPVSLFAIRSGGVFILSMVIALAGYYLPVNPLLPGYALGFCFWVSGLWIARNCSEFAEKVRLLPTMFYFLAIENILLYNGWVTRILSLVKVPSMMKGKFLAQEIIQLNDAILLPFCFIIIICLSGITMKYKKVVFLLLQLIPLAILAIAARHGHLPAPLKVSAALLVVAGILYFVPLNETLFVKAGLWLGSVSYGIYICHFPILVLFGRLPFAVGSKVGYGIEVIIYLALTLLAGWWLEKKVHPFLKGWLERTLMRSSK